MNYRILSIKNTKINIYVFIFEWGRNRTIQFSEIKHHRNANESFNLYLNMK